MRIVILLAVLALGTVRSEAAAFRRATDRVVSLDPIRAGSVCEANAVALVYEPPLNIDYLARPYMLVPGACEMPVVSQDGLVYEFRVRDGVRFVDDEAFPGGRGRDVTAADFVYSLDRLADKKNASSGMWLMDGVARRDVVDERRFRITLKKPLHVFPWFMAMPYASAIPREAVEKYGSRFGARAVGSGPYRLESWRRNHAMKFVRRPEWPGWKDLPDVPRFDRVEHFVVDDVSTRWLMFLAGELDYLEGVSRDNWDAVVDADGNLRPSLAEKGFRLFASPVLQLSYVGFNMRDPLVGGNKKLRQALNCAFDFPAWRKFSMNRVMQCDGPLPPGVRGRLETPFAYAFNLEKAKRLLAEAGYPGGVDPKTGRRLRVEISMGRATQDARETVELMQSFYDKVGVQLDAKFMTWDAYLRAVSEGRTMMFLLGWVGDYPDAENFIQLFISKNVSPGANHSNYTNPEVDRLYDEAMAAKTESERLAAWQRVQEIVREDCPWIFLHYPKSYSITSPSVTGYTPTDFPYGMERYLSPTSMR